MDFSSLNPKTSNRLNIAARENDFRNVCRLLKKANPNCVDNRGWTCLHEAAAHDSYQSLVLILQHPDCRPLSETHEGHTPLYLACREHASLQTISALLNSVEDIANYGSTESVTPLHVVSSQGRVEVIQLLLQYGAIINVQDFDGDTPLHDAAMEEQLSSVTALLHAGADAIIRNEMDYTPFHLTCFSGSYDILQAMLPFIDDINQITANGDTPLILATQGSNDKIVSFLLQNGADPHIKNKDGEMALDLALTLGHSTIFIILLAVTDIGRINKDVIFVACKPHYFKLQILEGLLQHDLGPEFFDFHEQFHVTLERIGDICPDYSTNSPLNSYLNICEYIYNSAVESFRTFFYLFLMNGVGVNALHKGECPPLVYVHYSVHTCCFEEVFKILLEHGCNVDYSSIPNTAPCELLPDAFIASITSDPATIPLMLPYSLHCEPDYLLAVAYRSGVLGRIPKNVQSQLLYSIDSTSGGMSLESWQYYPPPLKHISRKTVRSVLRSIGINTTKQFLDTLDKLPIPLQMKYYLRYL